MSSFLVLQAHCDRLPKSVSLKMNFSANDIDQESLRELMKLVEPVDYMDPRGGHVDERNVCMIIMNLAMRLHTRVQMLVKYDEYLQDELLEREKRLDSYRRLLLTRTQSECDE